MLDSGPGWHYPGLNAAARNDEWLLAWPEHNRVVDVYHDHHWVASFKFEADARDWIRSQGGEASN